MSVKLRQSGASKSVSKMHVHKSGALKTVTRAWVRQSGTLKKMFDEMAVSLSTDSVTGYATSKTTITVIAGSVTVNVTGGVGTLTYAWTAVTAPGWTITNPASATTSFSTSCTAGADKTATFHCTVTDATGQALATGTVTAECINDYGF